MKIFFTLLALTFLCSCGTSREMETVQINSTEKTVTQDSTTVVKPAVLNGKVITPSTNNSSIGEPKQKKENQ